MTDEDQCPVTGGDRCRCDSFLHDSLMSASSLSLDIASSSSSSSSTQLDEKDFKQFLDNVRSGASETALSLLQSRVASFSSAQLDQAYLTACELGLVKVVSHLLPHLPNTRARTQPHGLTGLHLCAHYGHYDLAVRLLQHECPVECVTSSGQTALHFAAAHNQAHLVALLMEHDANINARDAEGNSVLHIASSNGYNPIVLMVLKAGAQAHVLNARHETPLEVAKSSEVCRIMLEYLIQRLQQPSTESPTHAGHKLQQQQQQQQQLGRFTVSMKEAASHANGSGTSTSVNADSSVPQLLQPQSEASPHVQSSHLPKPQSPFRELPSGPSSYLFWTAMGVCKDSYMFQNFGVYPFDRLNDTERVVVLTEVAEAMSGYKTGEMRCNLLSESALYAVFALMKLRIKKELEESELAGLHGDDGEEKNDTRCTWRRRVTEAYEQVYRVSAAQCGLNLDCFKCSVWNTVINLLARSLFGDSFWEKKRMFLSPNGLERVSFLKHFRVDDDYFPCRLPNTATVEIQLTFKKLIAMSKSFLCEERLDRSSELALTAKQEQLLASENECFCADCIAQLEVPLNFKLHFLEEAAAEKQKKYRNSKSHNYSDTKHLPSAQLAQSILSQAQVLSKGNLVSPMALAAQHQNHHASISEHEDEISNRARLDEIVLSSKKELKNYWSSITMEEKWCLTELSTTELQHIISGADEWETLRAALDSYTKYAYEEDVLEISEQCITIADDMCEEKHGMQDNHVLDAMVEALENLRHLQQGCRQLVHPSTSFTSVYHASSTAHTLTHMHSHHIHTQGHQHHHPYSTHNSPVVSDDEWDKRGRQLLENYVLSAFARKIAAQYQLKKQESRAQQVALELELELMQEEEDAARRQQQSGGKKKNKSKTPKDKSKNNKKAIQPNPVNAPSQSLFPVSPLASTNKTAIASSSAAASLVTNASPVTVNGESSSTESVQKKNEATVPKPAITVSQQHPKKKSKRVNSTVTTLEQRLSNPVPSSKPAVKTAVNATSIAAAAPPPSAITTTAESTLSKDSSKAGSHTQATSIKQPCASTSQVSAALLPGVERPASHTVKSSDESTNASVTHGVEDSKILSGTQSVEFGEKPSKSVLLSKTAITPTPARLGSQSSSIPRAANSQRQTPHQEEKGSTSQSSVGKTSVPASSKSSNSVHLSSGAEHNIDRVPIMRIHPQQQVNVPTTIPFPRAAMSAAFSHNISHSNSPSASDVASTPNGVLLMLAHSQFVVSLRTGCVIVEKMMTNIVRHVKPNKTFVFLSDVKEKLLFGPLFCSEFATENANSIQTGKRSPSSKSESTATPILRFRPHVDCCNTSDLPIQSWLTGSPKAAKLEPKQVHSILQSMNNLRSTTSTAISRTADATPLTTSSFADKSPAPLLLFTPTQQQPKHLAEIEWPVKLVANTASNQVPTVAVANQSVPKASDIVVGSSESHDGSFAAHTVMFPDNKSDMNPINSPFFLSSPGDLDEVDEDAKLHLTDLLDSQENAEFTSQQSDILIPQGWSNSYIEPHGKKVPTFGTGLNNMRSLVLQTDKDVSLHDNMFCKATANSSQTVYKHDASLWTPSITQSPKPSRSLGFEVNSPSNTHSRPLFSDSQPALTSYASPSSHFASTPLSSFQNQQPPVGMPVSRVAGPLTTFSSSKPFQSAITEAITIKGHSNFDSNTFAQQRRPVNYSSPELFGSYSDSQQSFLTSPSSQSIWNGVNNDMRGISTSTVPGALVDHGAQFIQNSSPMSLLPLQYMNQTGFQASNQPHSFVTDKPTNDLFFRWPKDEGTTDQWRTSETYINSTTSPMPSQAIPSVWMQDDNKSKHVNVSAELERNEALSIPVQQLAPPLPLSLSNVPQDYGQLSFHSSIWTSNTPQQNQNKSNNSVW